MILFAYTHWFWITILIVFIAAKPIETEDDDATVEQNTSNTPKITTPIITTTTMPPFSGSMLTSSDNSTSLTTVEGNMTAFNTVAAEEETLTTLETAYREADNESLSASAFDRAAAIAPEDTENRLTAAGITGITLGCVVLVAVICSLSYIWYRGRGFNRPQVLTDRSSNLDSSGYIDDTSVRDNSEEMYSLDNDSFLNSLEAMTIQNYWTDTVKHTKL